MGFRLSTTLLDTNKVGSDCTGADGDSNRTLTVSVALTGHELIYVNGRPLHPTEEYTTSGSVITFLGPVFNDEFIRVTE